MLPLLKPQLGCVGVAVAVTGVQTPGTVVTLLVGLDVALLASQLHRVSTVRAVIWL